MKISYSADGKTIIKAREIQGHFSIPTSVTRIDDGAFGGCRELTSIEIPTSVTEIGVFAFDHCSELTSIVIPESVKYISTSAFSGCSKLSSVVIPESVEEIFSGAFSRCLELTSINIPFSVLEIYEDAFDGCSNLKAINVSHDNPSYASEDGVLFNKEKTKLIRFPEGKEETRYSIPSTVSRIMKGAFSGCGKLTFVKIPESVLTIGYHAFCGSGLTSIDIPSTVLGIEGNAFEGCENLKNIHVCPDNPSYASEDGVLFNKEKTKLVRFPGGKEETQYSIPSSVTWIMEDAFNGCWKLTFLKMPESIRWIKDRAFCGCTGLSVVEIPKSVNLIGGHAFESCIGLTFVEIPESVKCIGDYAFNRCSNLTWALIPSSVSSIGKSIFDDTNLVSILCNIKNLKDLEIKDNPFPDYEGLIESYKSCKEFFLSIGEEFIDWDETQGKTLTIYVPKGMMEAYVNHPIFSKYRIVENKTPKIDYSPDGRILIKAYDIDGHCSIPSSVTKIAESAFQDCTMLTSIKIPSSVIEIGDKAFTGCTSLHGVGIPESITKIGTSVFQSCIMLKSVGIPLSVTEIGDRSFENCIKLWDVSIPSSVTKIGDEAFSSCELMSIKMPSSIPLIGERALGCHPICSIRVPKGRGDAYRNHPAFVQFKQHITE